MWFLHQQIPDKDDDDGKAATARQRTRIRQQKQKKKCIFIEIYPRRADTIQLDEKNLIRTTVIDMYEVR